MKRLTRSAQRALDRYLHTLRTCLTGSNAIDAHEVEHDVLGHIEQELSECREPIAWARLQIVLDRLGSPLMWVPEHDLPSWKQLLLRLRIGPEDWRLAYASFALWMLAVVALLAAYEPIALGALLGSFVTARAARAFGGELDQSDRSKRWLTEPALATAALVLGGAVLLSVLPAMALVSRELVEIDTLRLQFPSVYHISQRLVAVFERPVSWGWIRSALLHGGPWLLLPLGAWWLVLGGIARWRPRWFAITFSPGRPNCAARVGRLLMIAGALVIGTGVAIGLVKTLSIAI